MPNELTVPEDEELDAYSLLSRPTLELSDAQVERICEDLRRRRRQHVETGKPDKPKAERKAKAEPASAEAKRANTLALLAQLKLPGAD